MKKLYAALLAALLLLLCGCAGEPAAETTELMEVDIPPAQVHEPEEKPEILPEVAGEEAPAEEAVIEENISGGGEPAFSCMMETLQADVEEIVSYSIDRPHITTGDAAMDDALETAIAARTAQFVGNCENQIYEKAQALSAMAFVTVSCHTVQEGDNLNLNYVMQTEYRMADPDAAEDPLSEGEMTLVFDLTTGDATEVFATAPTEEG